MAMPWKYRKSTGERDALSPSADVLAALRALTGPSNDAGLTSPEAHAPKVQSLDGNVPDPEKSVGQ